MEHTFRQLQFDLGFLTTFRTGLTRVMRWHLMEMLAITFCHPSAPLKEHTPRSVRNRLGKVAILYHVTRFEFLGNNRIKPFVMEKPIRRFRNKVKALTCNNIGLLCQSIFCFIPSSTLILLARQVALKFREFAFCLAVKARVGYLLAIRGRQKILYADIHTTSRFRDTAERVRHFANDKAIPPACRLFQRDLFRVSDERTVLTDFDFTEFRHFQPVVSAACFTYRILTNTFEFAQAPRQRRTERL